MRLTPFRLILSSIFLVLICLFLWRVLKSERKDKILAVQIFADHQDPQVVVNSVEDFARSHKIILKQYSSTPMTVRQSANQGASIMIILTCVVIYETTPAERARDLEGSARWIHRQQYNRSDSAAKRMNDSADKMGRRINSNPF